MATDRTVNACLLFPRDRVRIAGHVWVIDTVTGGFTAADEKKPRDRRFRRLRAHRLDDPTITRGWRKPLDEPVAADVLITDD